MTVVLLIRHAVTDLTGKRLYGQLPGIHLSKRGREQAEDLAERLRGVPIRALYSSPLERCTETAEPLARALGIAVRQVPAIQEVDYGRWTNRSFPQLRRMALWKQLHTAPSSIRFPGGETLLEVQTRAIEALEAIAADHPRDTVAMLSHGDVIRLAVAHLTGVHIDLYHRLEVAPASVTAVALGQGTPRLLRLNDTGPLRAELGSSGTSGEGPAKAGR